MKNHNFSDQVCAVRVGLNDNCDEKDMGAPIIMKENDRCVNLNVLMLSLHYKMITFYFSYVIIGINVGFCVGYLPEIFTTFLTSSVWTWVQTVVTADQQFGSVGTGIGRVEFSTCQDVTIQTPPEEEVPPCGQLAVSATLMIDDSIKHFLIYSDMGN